MQEEISSI
jgi:hypothetical protein